MEAVKVGKRGTIIVPAKLRKRYGIEEGTLRHHRARGDGVLIRRQLFVPVERYTAERKAEFLLSTATTEKDYRRARKEVETTRPRSRRCPAPTARIDGSPLSSTANVLFSAAYRSSARPSRF